MTVSARGCCTSIWGIRAARDHRVVTRSILPESALLAGSVPQSRGGRDLDARKHVSAAIRDYIARERISREQLAFRTKLGKSTVDKLLIGIFSERTLAIVEGHTKLSLRAMLDGTAVTDSTTEPARDASDRPSIAVLPFTNIGADANQEYFADGVVEDIITALSRVPRLLVIARNSTFTYKNRAVDIRQVGQELGVRYVLEGSVRKADQRLRITGQLIDARTGIHLWADRYEGRLDDVFDLQDRITAQVVGAIMPRLMAAELTRIRAKRPDSLDAYDLYLRALAGVREMTRESNEAALLHVERALQFDPDYAVAAGLGAWIYTLRITQAWCRNIETEKACGIGFARTAIAKGPDDPEALAIGGYAIAFLAGELDEGLDAIDRSMKLNPNGAMASSHAGWVRCYLGRPREAIIDFERVVALSPLEVTLFRVHAGLALAHLLLEEFAEAAAWARRAIEGNPHYTPGYRLLAAALAHLDRIEEARSVAQRLLELMPDFNVDIEKFVLRRADGLAMYLDGMRKAGLPA
jgi:adenylate cyclase